VGTGHTEEFRDRGAGNSRLFCRLCHWFDFVHEVALGIPPDAAVGWDVVSLFGQHWKVILVTISLAIFGLGFCLAFRRFGRRIQASSR
jgi:hypothetical protein